MLSVQSANIPLISDTIAGSDSIAAVPDSIAPGDAIGKSIDKLKTKFD